MPLLIFPHILLTVRSWEALKIQHSNPGSSIQVQYIELDPQLLHQIYSRKRNPADPMCATCTGMLPSPTSPHRATAAPSNIAHNLPIIHADHLTYFTGVYTLIARIPALLMLGIDPNVHAGVALSTVHVPGKLPGWAVRLYPMLALAHSSTQCNTDQWVIMMQDTASGSYCSKTCTSLNPKI